MVTVNIISQFQVKVKYNIRDKDILFEKMLRECGDAGNTVPVGIRGNWQRLKSWFKMTAKK